jgi:DNA-binding transcriptional LysR family regulator
MELHQVRYFLAVGETLNFTRAAARCHVSQPSLTRAIKLLEAELGGPLFHRERGNTHLTELGRAVQPHLREVAAQAQAARGLATAFATLRDGRLPLGVGFGFALDHVRPGLRAFAAAHPDVAVELREAGAQALHAALRHGEIDLAFLTGRPHDIDDLHYHRVGLDHARILARAEHRLARAAHLPLAALAGETLAVRAGCGFVPILRRRLAEIGRSARERPADCTPALLAEQVLACGGLALGLASQRVPAGVVGMAIAELPEGLPVFAATKRGRPHAPPVGALLDLLLRRPPSAVPAGLG